MPSSIRSKKDLYLAESMTKLNSFAEIPTKMTSSSARILVKTAEKMLKEAETSESLGDEERAYVLYMKYFNVVTYIKKTQDYKKDKEYYSKLLGQKNLLTSIEKAESLSSNLKERYDFVEAKHVADKLAALKTVDDQEEETKSKDGESNKKEEEEKYELKAKVEPVLPSILPTDLYHSLLATDGNSLIMDVRSAGDFKESHINHKCCINVPSEIIPPGTTVTYINKSLPPQSQALWSKRSSMEKIVLLDWDSTLYSASIGTAIRTLKDAIFKYDSTVILQHEPLILEGGYDQWLLYYPTMTTNSNVTRPNKSRILSPVPSLDFDYPDFDSAFIMTPSPSVGSEKRNAPIAQDIPSSRPSSNAMNGGNSAAVPDMLPRVDRSTKPLSVGTSGGIVVNIEKGTSGMTFNEATVKPTLPKLEPNKSRTSDTQPSTTVTVNGENILERSSSTSLTNYSKEIESELAELEKIKKQKEDELLKFSKEKKVLALEHKARLEKLKLEENKLSELEKLKQQQQKDVSDLMRMKRKLQEDIRVENEEVEENKRQNEEEEIARKEELELMQKQEEDKKRRQTEVEKLRLERKKKEDARIKLEQGEKERTEKEAADKAILEASERARREEENRQIEIRLAEERAEKLRQDLEVTRVEKEQIEKEEQFRITQEYRVAEETKRKLKEQEKKQEKERLERENIAKEKIEKEKADQARKTADENMKKINEEQSKTKVIPSPGLPVGWEKRLDNNTRRYFYINHRQGTTQWEPPVTPVKLTPATPQTGTFTAKLQDEPSKSTRGLKRSNSSPNIAQMMEDEKIAGKISPVMPQVDRTKKPPGERTVNTPRSMPQKVILIRDLQPVYGNVGRAMTGLRNLGNTCYMNSTIQCLNNTSPLVTYFLQGNYVFDINRESVLGCHGEVADDFAIIVKALWSGQYRCITPRDFKAVVGKHQPMFAGYDQQDSQEFLTFLLDGLHEGLNRIKQRPQIPEQDNENVPDSIGADVAWKHHLMLNESIIVELFQGQFRSTLQCLTCRKMSVTFQVFMYLSLPIVSSSKCTLQDCLKHFLREEKMTGSSRWKCPRCKVERDSVKKIDIWKLPRILLIGLNRFFNDGPWRQKISTYVDFPVGGLDLSSFVQSSKHRGHPYHLYGISNHYGTMEGGHYTASCRNPCTQKWYKFDDHEVLEMSASEVKTSAAFVLYYTSIELMPPDFRQQFS